MNIKADDMDKGFDDSTKDDLSAEGGLIPCDLMGEIWPGAQAGAAPGDYGSALIDCNGPVEIRTFQTFTLTYVAGRFGLDDTGGIKIVQRFTNDGGRWQTSDPKAMNYVCAHSSNGTHLDLEIEPRGHARPWDRSLRVVVDKGSLSEGDTIKVVFGDTSGGGPGLRMQTFCESAHEFRVLVDPCATGQFVPLSERPHVVVIAGPPHSWRAVLPTLLAPGDSFSLGLRADDIWGNPSHQSGRKLNLKTRGEITCLPEMVDFPVGQRSLRIDGLSAPEGEHQVDLLAEDGTLLAQSNILVVRPGPLRGFWGDLHGQSGETVGINPIGEYFFFGRDLAFLDVMGHQANDFQIRNAFWDEINTVTAHLNTPGKFVVFPGYEWSGNTPTGGDHNVFFRQEGRQIRRSSHAMLEDVRDRETDANTTGELFEALTGEDCVLYAHIGGRPANIAQADGGALRTALEVHSDWGTFEWVMADNFELGYRHGLVCNSDGHKGRPGASHPGASSFGALGGLTCFLTPNLSRDGIFDAMRRRHHYGTTGCRLHLDVHAHFDSPARIFHSDPRLGKSECDESSEAMMGDIVATRQRIVEINVEVHSASPVLSVEILRGMEVVATEYGYQPEELGKRFRVTFHGAEYRGRGRQTNWKGTARFDGAGIGRFTKINAWNHDRLLEQTSATEVAYDILTTGNFVGFDAWLSSSENSVLNITSNLVEARFDLASMGIAPVVHEAGGLDRSLRITRLPNQCETSQISICRKIDIDTEGDTPIWVRVTTEDGHLAWSSPIYLFAG